MVMVKLVGVLPLLVFDLLGLGEHLPILDLHVDANELMPIMSINFTDIDSLNDLKLPGVLK